MIQMFIEICHKVNILMIAKLLVAWSSSRVIKKLFAFVHQIQEYEMPIGANNH